jgi:uncharacterized SAM-dependent methyltransferase
MGSNFNLQDWEHVAFFNESQSRIEMHLRARSDVEAILPSDGAKEQLIQFKAGDLIHTENSYKYTEDGFTEKLRRAGFDPIHTWTDPKKHFLVCFANAKN